QCHHAGSAGSAIDERRRERRARQDDRAHANRQQRRDAEENNDDRAHSRNRTPRPPPVLGAPGAISSIPAAFSAAMSFISESTFPRTTSSLASMRWIVGTERPVSS